jgi:hypothetical protein
MNYLIQTRLNRSGGGCAVFVPKIHECSQNTNIQFDSYVQAIVRNDNFEAICVRIHTGVGAKYVHAVTFATEDL